MAQNAKQRSPKIAEPESSKSHSISSDFRPRASSRSVLPFGAPLAAGDQTAEVMRGVAALLLVLPGATALADRPESAFPPRSVSVTFDDLPAVRGNVDDVVALNRRLLKALNDAGSAP